MDTVLAAAIAAAGVLLIVVGLGWDRWFVPDPIPPLTDEERAQALELDGGRIIPLEAKDRAAEELEAALAEGERVPEVDRSYVDPDAGGYVGVGVTQGPTLLGHVLADGEARPERPVLTDGGGRP